MTNENKVKYEFTEYTSKWWDAEGPFKTLHLINPLRLHFITSAINETISNKEYPKPLEGLNILDVGCGGGLLCEPLARLGAKVTGIDLQEKSIFVAQNHAESCNLNIEYLHTDVNTLVEEKRLFDVVCSLEVIEHVDDTIDFITNTCKLIKQNGLFIGSTINRTKRAWLLAIVAAEYALRWLPKGTHQWEKFVTVDEFTDYLRLGHVEVTGVKGMCYSPFHFKWYLEDNTSVNYLVKGIKQ